VNCTAGWEGVARVLHAERAKDIVGDEVGEVARGDVLDGVAEDLVACVGVYGNCGGQVLWRLLEERTQSVFAGAGDFGAEIVGVRRGRW